MVEKRKHHFDPNETKIGIIKFILENGPVSEPDISKFINEKYGGFDRATVNKHLSRLRELSSIEKVSHLKKSRLNYWDIETLKNLKNIRSNFPKIRLNEYEKVLAVVLHGNGYTIKELIGLQIYIRLFLSPSFFNMCLEIGFETMCLRAWEIYRHKKGFNFHKLINDNWKILTEDPYPNAPSYDELVETFLRAIGELPVNISEILEDVSRWSEIEDEIITKLQLDEVTTIFLPWMILEYIEIFSRSFLSLLSDHFCNQDILLGVATDAGKKFVEKTDDHLALYRGSEKSYNVNKWMLDDLENASEIIFEHKTPSFFPIHDNSKDLYQYLIKFYEKELKIEKRKWGNCSYSRFEQKHMQAKV